MAVASLLEKQVDALVRDVQLLTASKGHDKKTAARVRAAVTGALLHPQEGKLAAVCGKLAGTEAEACFKEVLADCRQHFYMEDRLLSVLVAPVAVKLRSRMDGAVSVDKAGPEDLKTLGMLMSRRVGSKSVVFDTRIYTAKDLVHASAGQLLDLAMKLERGEQNADVGMTSTKLTSKSEAAWEMVYLVGVEVNELDDEPIADSEEAQSDMLRWRCYAEQAISEVDEVLLNDKVTADVKSHGIWYLAEGQRLGEDLIRSYRLEALVREFEQGTRGVRFLYAVDHLQGVVRLMLQNRLMTVEHKWRLFAGEGLDGFRHALDQAIDACVPEDDVVAKREMELDEYEKLARESGVMWS